MGIRCVIYLSACVCVCAPTGRLFYTTRTMNNEAYVHSFLSCVASSANLWICWHHAVFLHPLPARSWSRLASAGSVCSGKGQPVHPKKMKLVTCWRWRKRARWESGLKKKYTVPAFYLEFFLFIRSWKETHFGDCVVFWMCRVMGSRPATMGMNWHIQWRVYKEAPSTSLGYESFSQSLGGLRQQGHLT